MIDPRIDEELSNGRRKSSKGAAWGCAHAAVELSGRNISIPMLGNFPDFAELRKLLEADRIIITRHVGLVQWLKNHGIEGKVIAQATENDVKGNEVFGVLPLHLAALAVSITTVDMPGLIQDQRGKDLTPEEMDQAGATLKTYIVREVTK